MTFEWDDAKNRVNIRKHGFDFAEAEEMFRGFLLVRPDTREDWRGAMARHRDDSGPLGLHSVRSVLTRHRPRHLAAKGKS